MANAYHVQWMYQEDDRQDKSVDYQVSLFYFLIASVANDSECFIFFENCRPTEFCRLRQLLSLPMAKLITVCQGERGGG